MPEISIPNHILTIIQKLENGGFETYAVGGCVRDSIMKRAVNDWDICTSAVPNEVKNCLSEFKIIDTGLKHGTVTVVVSGNACEITTFRTESGYSDHRHPAFVNFTKTIDEDLSRRDFTVNAMAYSPIRGFVDNFHGLDDIESKIIRCVGIPSERFGEDALRIMRALRFSSQLDFEIERKTADAVIKKAPTLAKIAKERINHELCKLLLGVGAGRVMREFKSVFKEIFKNEYIFKDWDEKAYLVDSSPKRLLLRLAYVLSGIAYQDSEHILHELRFDTNTVNCVTFLLRNGKFTPPTERIALKRIVSQFGYERLFLLFDYIRTSPAVRENLSKLMAESPPLWIRDLAINGKDIMDLGVNDGLTIGKLLNLALKAVISEECPNTKTDLIKLINEKIGR